MEEGELQIRPLTAEEENAKVAALQLAARLVGATPPLSLDQVQALYYVIRDDFPDFQEAQIGIGIAFGELIAAKAGLEWVRLTDEYGSETSLAPAGFQEACHPISMIQKRIERREDLDLADLRDWTIEQIQKGIEQGRWGPRNTGHTG